MTAREFKKQHEPCCEKHDTVLRIVTFMNGVCIDCPCGVTWISATAFTGGDVIDSADRAS